MDCISMWCTMRYCAQPIGSYLINDHASHNQRHIQRVRSITNFTCSWLLLGPQHVELTQAWLNLDGHYIIEMVVVVEFTVSQPYWIALKN